MGKPNKQDHRLLKGSRWATSVLALTKPRRLDRRPLLAKLHPPPNDGPSREWPMPCRKRRGRALGGPNQRRLLFVAFFVASYGMLRRPDRATRVPAKPAKNAGTRVARSGLRQRSAPTYPLVRIPAARPLMVNRVRCCSSSAFASFAIDATVQSGSNSTDRYSGCACESTLSARACHQAMLRDW